MPRASARSAPSHPGTSWLPRWSASCERRTPDMKVDGGIGFDLARAAETAREAEAAGYDGVWSAETSHDPFFPLLLAAEHPERIELGTGIAVAFPRSPMHLANLANDLQAYSGGRFLLGLGSQIRAHVEKRFSATWSHPPARRRE